MQTITINNCPICESPKTECIFTPGDEHKQQFKTLSRIKYSNVMDNWLNELSLKLMKCQSCTHVWHHQIPSLELLSAMYSGASGLKKNVPSHPSNARQKYILNEMKFFKSLIPAHQGRFLDYGSGKGHWLQAAQLAGFSEITAYDISHDRLTQSSEQSGAIKLINTLNNESEPFHAVNCEQVFEHTISPVKELRALKPLLTPTSILRITVPIIEEKWSTLELLKTFPFKGNNVHILSPYEHIHGFTRKSFETFIQSSGFRLTSPGLLKSAKYPRHLMREILKRSNYCFAQMA